MATKPHIPYQEQPQLVPNTDRLKPKWLGRRAVVLGAIAVVLVGGIAYFLLRAHNSATNAQIPAQPVPGELQFHGLQVVAGQSDNSFYLYGHVKNTGPYAVNGILAEVKLRGPYENVLLDVKRPMEGMVDQDDGLVSAPFAKDPLRPGETRPFRVSIARAPAWWNHNIPDVQIVKVTGQRG